MWHCSPLSGYSGAVELTPPSQKSAPWGRFLFANICFFLRHVVTASLPPARLVGCVQPVAGAATIYDELPHWRAPTAHAAPHASRRAAEARAKPRRCAGLVPASLADAATAVEIAITFCHATAGGTIMVSGDTLAQVFEQVRAIAGGNTRASHVTPPHSVPSTPPPTVFAA